MKSLLPFRGVLTSVACATMLCTSSVQAEDGVPPSKVPVLISPDQVLQQVDSSDESSTAPSLDLSAPGEVETAHGESITPDASIAPAPEREPLSPQMLALRDRMREVLALYYQKNLNTRDHNPWEMMHGIIAYGVDTNLRVGDPRGPQQNAIGWLCFNRACKGQSLMTLRGNMPVGLKGVGLQGHHGQLLAILAQSKLVPDYPIRVSGRKFTVRDLVKSEMLTCYPNEELTFKLISLVHYLPTDTQWKNDRGETWDIPRLIAEEIRQPVSNQVACGGTHRLMGLSYAVYKRKQRNEPVDGQYARAEKYIDDFHDYTFSLQNPDGSFSTDWFRGRGARPDIDRRLRTTGHIFEWLAFSLPAEELESPQMINAVTYLTNLMHYNQRHEWEVGPLGHAIRGLALYDARVFEARESGTAPDFAIDSENQQRATRDETPRTAQLHPRVGSEVERQPEVKVEQAPATPQLNPHNTPVAPQSTAPEKLNTTPGPVQLQQPQSQLPITGPQLFPPDEVDN